MADLTPGMKVGNAPSGTPLDGVAYAGHTQGELKKGSVERPAVGRPNAVTRQGDGTASNDSGVIQAPGASLPSGGAPSVSATGGEKSGPAPHNPGDRGASQI